MSIYLGSRYENDAVDRVLTHKGEFIPTVYHQVMPLLQVFGFSLYTTGYYERLDSLADRFLGDSELGWIIANANPELFYPDFIPTGTVLRIPDARVLG